MQSIILADWFQYKLGFFWTNEEVLSSETYRMFL